MPYGVPQAARPAVTTPCPAFGASLWRQSGRGEPLPGAKSQMKAGRMSAWWARIG